ncbi:hypothetical protein J7E62_03055 [Variovorax paradoxus]|nr:hypothetical protein [Variovorax paradoxus]
MDPADAMRKRFGRFFAWTFVVATVLMVGLFWVEARVPQAPTPRSAPAPVSLASAGSSFDIHEALLLATAAALIAALASLLALGIGLPLARFKARRERMRAEVNAALKLQENINRLAARRNAVWSKGIDFQAAVMPPPSGDTEGGRLARLAGYRRQAGVGRRIAPDT